MPFWRYAGPAGCYDQAQQDAVRSIMKSDAVVALSKKQPLYIKFDHVACRIDHAGPHVSFILLADAWSNQLLEGFARSVEAEVAAQGIRMHVPRSTVEPFHVTLGWVMGPVANTLPFASALNDVNSAFTFSEWPVYSPSVPRERMDAE